MTGSNVVHEGGEGEYMSHQTRMAGISISKALRPSEDALDGAIVKSAELIMTVINGRMAAGLAAESGHGAIMSLTRSMAKLAEARDDAMAGHRQLTELRDRMGFNEHAFGCTNGKVPSDGSTRGSHLRVAAA